MDWTKFWEQFMPPQRNAPWTPTYLPQQFVSSPDNFGGMQSHPLNVMYFPDSTSCEHLRQKYNPRGSIIYQNFVSGPVTQSASVPYLVWPNGVAIMAGMLASLWSQNPGHQDVADSLCLAAIASRGAA